LNPKAAWPRCWADLLSLPALRAAMNSFLDTSTPKLVRLLARLDVATRDQDMNLPGWGLHPLSGDLKGPFQSMATGE
jgi:hypothetical protein